MATILLETAEFLAIDKPSGLLCHASVDRGRADALSVLRAKRPELTELSLVHRLDAGTSGVLLFAKNSAAQTAITQAFRDKLIEKTYLAICRGSARERIWSVTNHLREKSGGGQSRMVAVRAGGDRAHTDFEILESKKGRHLVLAQPRTGRRHQIRVHLADSLGPIEGDATYGGDQAERLRLHALRLIVPPLEGMQGLTVTAPVPGEFWGGWGDLSEAVAERLRG